jgi:hypothetical protein
VRRSCMPTSLRPAARSLCSESAAVRPLECGRQSPGQVICRRARFCRPAFRTKPRAAQVKVLAVVPLKGPQSRHRQLIPWLCLSRSALAKADMSHARVVQRQRSVQIVF